MKGRRGTGVAPRNPRAVSSLVPIGLKPRGRRMNPHSAGHEGVRAGHPAGAVQPRRRVLVVEDEFFLAVQIEEWLVAGGFDVVDVVHTADEAIAGAVADRPGLVIMDIR